MSKQPVNLNAVFGRFRRRMLAAELSTAAVERRDIGNASEPARGTMPATPPDSPPRLPVPGAWRVRSRRARGTPCAVSSAAVERSTGTPDHQQTLRGDAPALDDAWARICDAPAPAVVPTPTPRGPGSDHWFQVIRVIPF